MLKSIGIVGLLAAACMMPGCGAMIDTGPDYRVAYAIEQISPAVVRLDISEDQFANGQLRPVQAIGSGTIIDAEGHILTNFHVAGRAKRIMITLGSKEQVRATLVGSDHWTDLALVKLDMEDVKKRKLKFTWAKLANSDEVKLGQPVMAMGSPHGLARTLTKGIISNTEREFQASAIDGYETGWFNNWLQMDAAINPGNSGGPLMNLRGEIVGINTRGGEGNLLGFAIPVNVAKQVIPEILKHGKVTRSYVGLQFQSLLGMEKHYDLPGDKGILIRSVDRYSPASEGGMQTGDVLLAINDQPVLGRFEEELAPTRKMIADFPLGAELKMKVLRSVNGTEKQMELTVKTEKLESAVTEEKSLQAWGITVRELTKAYLRSTQTKPVVDGVLVTGVRATSLAETAKLATDDVITKVNGKPVLTIAELEEAIREWSAKKEPVSIDVRRGDRQQMTLVLKAKE